MMAIKLVIFDLDGTLADTAGDITDALNYALAPSGRPPLKEEETIKLVGEGLTGLVEKILGEQRKDSLKETLDRFLDYYSGHLIVRSVLYPGVKETVESLEGIKKAVISNKREALSRRLLEGLSLAGHFDMIVGSDTTPERKPSPVPVLYVLESLGVKAYEAAMVGDSNLDIEAGRQAGVKTVAVTYGYRPRGVLAGADFMIDDISELPALLCISRRGA